MVLSIKTSLKLFSDFVEQRIDAYKQVSEKKSKKQSHRINSIARELQDAQKITNGIHCKNNNQRSNSIVASL